MTRNEARDQIVIFMCDEQKVINDRDKQALDMAIQALEQEPKTVKSCDTCKYSEGLWLECGRCDKDMTNYSPKQADGEYILKKDVMCCIGQTSLHWELARKLRKLSSVAIPPEHDGCEGCRWQSQSEIEMPCKQCMHNYTDEWEREKPIDTITMTREEFSEKLMEHYRQGRADEKAYQNGEIMQSFNPD